MAAIVALRRHVSTARGPGATGAFAFTTPWCQVPAEGERRGRYMAVGARRLAALSCATALGASLAGAQMAGGQEAIRSVNTYGVPGLIDMPSAQMQPDAELTASVSATGDGSGRSALTFQIAPRVQGVFRYATIDDYRDRDGDGQPDRTWDRSFDVRVQLFREGRYTPAVTVGLQDFGGTGLFQGEYVVATKEFAEGRIAVTGGIGWGRFGTAGSFDNPLGVIDDRFDTRPGGFEGEGGDFSADNWFRGPAALFGGIEWRQNDRLTFKAEYSSDAYELEESVGVAEVDSRFNFGVDYQITPNATASLYALRGNEIGLGFKYTLNPFRPPAPSGLEGAPLPVQPRPSRAANPELWTEAWAAVPNAGEVIEPGVKAALEAQGLQLQAYRLEGDRAEIRFINRRYESQAQAIGRAARGMTGALPPSVETFVLVPVNPRGLAGAAVVLRRSDIEALENRPFGAAEILATAGIVDAASLPGAGLTFAEDVYPRFDWGIGPYLQFSYFDPESPIRVDTGVQVSARWQPARGLVFSGAVRQKLLGNRDEQEPGSDSELPPVRTLAFEYVTDEPHIPYLQGAYYFRPGRNLYGRMTAGLLERQYGGVSGELLWNPATGPFALGLELSHARQRDFDMLFDFRDLEATTAFVSAYLEHGGGYRSQLDVGQYLAGDRGATFTFSRVFANGWEVGAYATKTDVSAEEFGEGSFDKGISLRIPTTWITGIPSRSASSEVIQPIQRDGGARLRIRGRLRDVIDDQTGPQLTDDWGRFWR
jgi:hypothetical protein